MLSSISLGRNDGLTRIDIADVGYACGFVGCTIREPERDRFIHIREFAMSSCVR